jgi:hypothetical protein
MQKILRGIIHGKTFELLENPGLDDGKEVQLVLKVSRLPRPWGEGIRNSACGLANEWTEEDDRILEEIYQDRTRQVFLSRQLRRKSTTEKNNWVRKLIQCRRFRCFMGL